MTLNEKFRIKRQYSIIAHSPDIVELRSGVWNPTSFTINDESQSGRLFSVLAGLDGSLSPAELAKKVSVPQADVETMLDQLIQMSIVESGSSNSLDYYVDNLVPGLTPRYGDLPGEMPIVLMGDPDLAAGIQRYLKDSLKTEVSVVDEKDPVWTILQENDTSWLMDGIAFQERVLPFQKWQGKFLVFATEIINPVQFQILNRASWEWRIPWLHAAIDGPFLFVGPTFVPPRSACYECFETRVLMNLRENESYLRYKRAIVEGQIRRWKLPVEPALVGLLAAHAALEALNFVLTGSSFTVGKVLALYLPTMEFTFNEVLRVPGCPACGPSPERDDRELYFSMRALMKPQN